MKIQTILLTSLLYSNVFLAMQKYTYEVPRPMTPEEIAAYKKAHPKYTIHPETYKETTALETVLTRTPEDRPAWSESTDTAAQAKWSDREKNLEGAMKEKRSLDRKKQDAAKVIQKKWKEKHQKAKDETESKLSLKELNKKLRTAVSNNNITEVKQALAEGADINYIDTSFKYSAHNPALHYAWKPQMIQFLLDAGANINAQDFNGDTALHHLAENPEGVKVLLHAKANTEIKGRQQETPLDRFCQQLWWARNDSKEKIQTSIKELMRHGAKFSDKLSDILKEDPAIKKIARELRDEKIAYIQNRQTLARRLGWGPESIVNEYVGE